MTGRVGYLVRRPADQREEPGPADAGAARSGEVIRQDELTLRAEDGAYLEQGMAGTAGGAARTGRVRRLPADAGRAPG